METRKEVQLKLFCFAAIMSAMFVLGWALQSPGQDFQVTLGADLQKQLRNAPPTTAKLTITPETAEQYSPIVAVLDAEIPDGAIVFGDGWTCSDGVQTVSVGSTVKHIWASPGEHTIGYNGLWMKTEEVEIIDTSGNKRKMTSLVGYGFINTSATFSVEGEQRPDPPTPGPLPDGIKVVFVLEESSQRTPGQAEVMTALRRWCEKQGLQYRQLDPDQPSVENWAKPYKEKIQSASVALPALVASVIQPSGEVFFAEVATLPGGSREAIAAVQEAFEQ